MNLMSKLVVLLTVLTFLFSQAAVATQRQLSRDTALRLLRSRFDSWLTSSLSGTFARNEQGQIRGLISSTFGAYSVGGVDIAERVQKTLVALDRIDPVKATPTQVQAALATIDQEYARRVVYETKFGDMYGVHLAARCLASKQLVTNLRIDNIEWGSYERLYRAAFVITQSMMKLFEREEASGTYTDLRFFVAKQTAVSVGPLTFNVEGTKAQSQFNWRYASTTSAFRCFLWEQRPWGNFLNTLLPDPTKVLFTGQATFERQNGAWGVGSGFFGMGGGVVPYIGKGPEPPQFQPTTKSPR